MKELDFLNIINATIDDNEYLGDDCAKVSPHNLVVTQDTLVENKHFKLNTISPCELGMKAIAVNLSDIAASGAKPFGFTISLSIPPLINTTFIHDFYMGVNKSCTLYNINLLGGDITSSSELNISVCMFGEIGNRKISSRKFAKVGDLVITTGEHGSSAFGLELLLRGLSQPFDVIKKHIYPIPKLKESELISSNIKRNYAMMDTSDGIGDALIKISQASQVNLEIDFSKIVYNNQLNSLASQFGKNLEQEVLFGGEDFELVACVNQDFFNEFNLSSYFYEIGKVTKNSNSPKVFLKNCEKFQELNSYSLYEYSFNHFS